jgi:hypothetical protein
MLALRMRFFAPLRMTAPFGIIRESVIPRNFKYSYLNGKLTKYVVSLHRKSNIAPCKKSSSSISVPKPLS